MGSEGEVGEEVQPRAYWRWSKQDFLPEESFQNWSTYRTALSQMHHRFKDRLISRSNDENETGELRKQSENDMKRCLTWWDLIWFGFGSVIGAGIFVLTGQETHEHAGPAIVLSYVASGISAMLSVFCYTEFSVEIPVAGGSFAYLRIELGDFVAFLTAGNILLESVVGSAAVARSWTSYFTSLLNRPSNSLRFRTNLTEGYNLLDPIAVVVLAVAGSSWCSQGNDHCSSGGNTWTGSVYHSHSTRPHDTTMVCSCPSKDRHPYKRYTLDSCFEFLHCFLFKLKRLDRPLISEHTLYLHDDGCCTSSEEILRERCHLKTTSLEASCLLGDHYFFLNRDFSLLGIESQWLDGLCCDCSSLVLCDFGNVSVSTSTEVTKSMGGSTGSLVAILVNRHKYFSYGIFGFFCF